MGCNGLHLMASAAIWNPPNFLSLFNPDLYIFFYFYFLIIKTAKQQIGLTRKVSKTSVFYKIRKNSSKPITTMLSSGLSNKISHRISRTLKKAKGTSRETKRDLISPTRLATSQLLKQFGPLVNLFLPQ